MPIDPPGPPGGDPGDGGDNNPTITTTSATSSSVSSSSSQLSLSHTQTEGYQVAACGRDASAAARTTTFTTKGTATHPPAQTVTTNCAVCVLPYGSVDPECDPIPGCVPSGSSTPSAYSTAAAAASTPTAVFPTATGVNCGSSSTGGSRLADCLGIMGGVLVPNDNTQICTNDQSKCISSGESVGNDPNVITSNYCEIGQNSGCAVVIANKLSTFGFPGL